MVNVMLIETGIILTATSVGMLWNHHTNSSKKVDKQMDKTIREIFENIGFGIAKGKGRSRWVEYPRLLNSKVHKTYVSLVYKLPLGANLSMLDRVKDSIQEALGTDNMNLSVAGKSVIKMQIATQPMPDRVPLAPFIGKFKKWEVPLGVHQFGVVTHDFDYYPAIVGGGVIQFGKSTFIKNLVSLLITQNPDDVEFYILDLKEGVEFGEFKQLKQIKSVATNLEQAESVLEQLDEDLRKTSHWYEKNNIKNIKNTGIKKRKFVIVDEAHELAPPEHLTANQKKPYKKCQHLLQRIVSKGGFCGFRVIAFTQYPVKESMPQRIKQNSLCRLTLRVADAVASRVILDEEGAEKIPPVKGRAIYKSFQKETLQIPYSDNHFEEFLTPFIEKEVPKDNVIEGNFVAETTTEHTIKD